MTHFLKNHLDSATVCRSTSTTIQNDFLKVGSIVVKEETKKEVQAAKFLSIMLD
ncbi:hypothetical protein Cfor_07277 [Coptotermes formosanus]|jgi:hypothetical protein|uniref:Uncharacterized protein n=1 Tax=Coptotermes formosanus TaxID=36987 RepID=A0A6L2Q8N5_COPFO|nr:hypothetical protein Cfor_07277 [Coptotermes formosanus]